MIIDYFAFAGTYPFGEPGTLTVDGLLAELAADGVGRGYVSNAGAVFLKEPTAVETEFIRACRARSGSGALLPVPVLDLSTNTFEQDIARYAREFHVPGVRIAPNYHGYTLNTALAARLLAALAERNLMLFVARELEDCRFVPPCLDVRPISLADLAPLLRCPSSVKIILNNFGALEITAAPSPYAENIFFDVAAFDGSFYSMERLIETHGTGRFVYGSGVPFLYRGAVLYNLRHSLLSQDQIARILEGCP